MRCLNSWTLDGVITKIAHHLLWVLQPFVHCLLVLVISKTISNMLFCWDIFLEYGFNIHNTFGKVIVAYNPSKSISYNHISISYNYILLFRLLLFLFPIYSCSSYCFVKIMPCNIFSARKLYSSASAGLRWQQQKSLEVLQDPLQLRTHVMYWFLIRRYLEVGQ